MTPRRLFIINLWNAAANLPVPALPGWERLALVNCGMGPVPHRPTLPASGGCLIDWEPEPMPPIGDREGRRAFRREWCELLRGAAEGTVAYGVDPSVHWGPVKPQPPWNYDDATGQIAYMLRVGGRTYSWGLDYYADKVRDLWAHKALCTYRRSRLLAVQGMNETDSVQFVCGQRQAKGKDNYGDGAEVLPPEWLDAQVNALGSDMSVCVFAAASTAKGYEAAVRGLTEMVKRIDAASKVGGAA